MSTDTLEHAVFQHNSPNNDGFCAVSAFLATSRTRTYYMDPKYGLKRWRRDATHLENECNAGQVSRSGFEVEDFGRIVANYSHFRIVLISSITCEAITGSEGVFQGNQWQQPDIENNPKIIDDPNTVWILKEHDRYYWIRSIGGFTRHRHGNAGHAFCPLCFKWIRTRFETHKCDAFKCKCFSCGTVKYDNMDALMEHRSQDKHGCNQCDKCGMVMASGECFDKHSSWCRSNKKLFEYCVECKVPYHTKYDHKCGMKRCLKCSEYYKKEVAHQCFMRRDKDYADRIESEENISNEFFDDENDYDQDDVSTECSDIEDEMQEQDIEVDKETGSKPKKAFHYAYDIESRLEKEPPSSEGVFQTVHYVCLIMVKPLYVKNATVLKFYSLDDFFKWVLKKERSRCTFWAHNAKGYDNRFLYEYLCTSLKKLPQKCLWKGDKLMQFVIKSRKFNDSLCHLSRALSDLPKMLGLKGEYSKGFFPYKFVTKENMGYKGPLPDKEHFDYIRMKPDRYNAFQEWYDQERVAVGHEWSLKENLESYCENDVNLLAEALETYDTEMTSLNNGISPLGCATIASYAMKVYKNLHMPLNKICELTPEQYRFVKEAFRGGRTEVRCLQREWSKEELEADQYGVYVDIQSMYPSVQYHNAMPCGIPKWHRYSEDVQPDIHYLMSFMGFINCDIKPTKYMHHPILGGVDPKTKKYMFTLKEMKQVTITSDELQVALENGYELTHVYKILEFEREEGIFKDYVKKFLKIKVEAKAFQGSDEEWEHMKKRHKEELGIELDRSRMIENKGRREMAKLMLNSLWGKFGQRPDLQQEGFFNDEKYNELSLAETRGEVQVYGTRDLPDGITAVRYCKKNIIDNLLNKNVAIAAFVSAGGRLMLWKTLNALDDRVLYHDTDSILYERSTNVSKNVCTGKLLGEWGDEHPEDKIVDFVGLGPKTYGFRTLKGDVVMKCKGFTMDKENDRKLTIEKYKELVKDYVDGKESVVETMSTFFGYDKTHDVYYTFTQDRNKRLKLTANKSAIDRRSLKTYPFGYEKFGREIDEI